MDFTISYDESDGEGTLAPEALTDEAEFAGILLCSLAALLSIGRIFLRYRLDKKLLPTDHVYLALLAVTTIYITINGLVKVDYAPRYGQYVVFDARYVAAYVNDEEILSAQIPLVETTGVFYHIGIFAAKLAFLHLYKAIIWPFPRLRRLWWALAIVNSLTLGFSVIFQLALLSTGNDPVEYIILVEYVVDMFHTLTMVVIAYLPFLLLWQTKLRRSFRISTNLLLWGYAGIFICKLLVMLFGPIMWPAAIEVPFYTLTLCVTAYYPLINRRGRRRLRKARQPLRTSELLGLDKPLPPLPAMDWHDRPEEDSLELDSLKKPARVSTFGGQYRWSYGYQPLRIQT